MHWVLGFIITFIAGSLKATVDSPVEADSRDRISPVSLFRNGMLERVEAGVGLFDDTNPKEETQNKKERHPSSYRPSKPH